MNNEEFDLNYRTAYLRRAAYSLLKEWFFGIKREVKVGEYTIIDHNLPDFKLELRYSDKEDHEIGIQRDPGSDVITLFVVENGDLMGFPVKVKDPIGSEVRRLINLFVPESLEQDICDKIDLDNLTLKPKSYITN